ncbi:MAG TPA: 3'(2'),5'-bisphosphate nucleotidase [Aquifex aeolicus]|nr:3'(2'),5'-bisphosphate nucleotidase [Aquifex aeolicus]
MLKEVIEIALRAGEETLKIYKRDFRVEYKEDKTPLTEADKISHEIIEEGLRKLSPEIPILSEEGSHIHYDERKNWRKLWLVDPLDGTKGFIKKLGDFTVNIALVENRNTVLGVVYAPAKGVIYFAEKGKGAKRADVKNGTVVNEVSIPQRGTRKVRVVVSRSHLDENTKAFLNNLKKKFDDLETINAGSSLKFCLLAEGKASVYPRFSPTMEWDTVAGHAILREAGGMVLIAPSMNEELYYNKETLKNPSFVAVSGQREVIDILKELA